MSRSEVVSKEQNNLYLAALVNLIKVKQNQVIDAKMVKQFEIALTRCPKTFGLDLASLKASVGKILKVHSYWTEAGLQYRFYYG